MNTLPKSFRTRVNRAERDHALRYEMQLRDQWTAELTAALQRRATYNELLLPLAGFETSSGASDIPGERVVG